MDQAYLLPADHALAEFKDRGSRFIGLVYRVESRKEIDEALNQAKLDYPDARHHCYAWRLLPDTNMQMASDDGEPRHSAGDPILGQILARNLFGTLVVVVRYFGGTKLGVPGLINAYRSAASLALDKAGANERRPGRWYNLSHSYEDTALVQMALAQLKLEPHDSQFLDRCSHVVWIDHANHLELHQRFQAHPDIRLTPCPPESTPS